LAWIRRPYPLRSERGGPGCGVAPLSCSRFDRGCRFVGWPHLDQPRHARREITNRARAGPRPGSASVREQGRAPSAQQLDNSRAAKRRPIVLGVACAPANADPPRNQTRRRHARDEQSVFADRAMKKAGRVFPRGNTPSRLESCQARAPRAARPSKRGKYGRAIASLDVIVRVRMWPHRERRADRQRSVGQNGPPCKPARAENARQRDPIERNRKSVILHVAASRRCRYPVPSWSRDRTLVT
jgi:hypothetical protein